MYFKKEDKNVYSLYRSLILEAEDGPEWAGKQLSIEDLTKAKDKLVRARMALKQGWNFFGHLLVGLSTCLTYEMDTMAVDDYGNIYINPYFLLNVLNDAETVGVLAHEVLHIANLTHFRGTSFKNFKLWNIATDYIMNRDLIQMGLSLPAFGCIPENKGGKKVIPSKPEIPKYWHGIDMTEMDAEELYRALDQAVPPQVKQQQQAMQQLQDMIDQITKGMDQHITGGKKQPTAIDINNLPGQKYKDSGLTPRKPTSTNRKDVETEMRKQIKEAINQMEQEAKGAGNIKGGIPQSFDKKHLEPAVNWREVLGQFLMPARKKTYDSQRFQARPLSVGVPMPKRKKITKKVDLAVAIDTSGSTTGDILATFLGAIYGIISKFPVAELRIILWHTEVYNEIEILKADQKVIITAKEPSKLGDSNSKDVNVPAAVKTDTQINTNGEVVTNLANARDVLMSVYTKYAHSGGTSVNSIKEYLDREGEQITGLLLLTDGDTTEGPNQVRLPTPPDKTVIMINNRGTDRSLKGKGRIVFVDIPEVETP